MQGSTGKIIGFVCVLGCASFAFADDKPQAKAGEAKAAKAAKKKAFQFSAKLDWASRYVFRGKNKVDDAVFQPSLSIDHGRLNATFWANMDLSRVNIYYGTSDGFSRVTEYKSSLSYTAPISNGKLSLGTTHYDFANTGRASTTEVWGKAAFKGELSPFVAAYFDVDEAQGAYIQLGGSRFYQFDKTGFGVNVTGTLGFGTAKFNKWFYGADKSGLTDFSLRTELVFPIDDQFALNTFAGFSALLNDDFRKGKPSTSFVLGSSFRIKF